MTKRKGCANYPQTVTGTKQIDKLKAKSPEAKEDKPWQWNRMTTSTGCARLPRARQPRGTQNTIESIATSWKQWNQTQMKTSLGSETVRQQVQDARGSRAEHKILLNLLCQSKSNEPRCKWRQALAVKPYDNKYRMCAAAARSTKYHWIFRDKPKAKSPEAHEDKPWQPRIKLSRWWAATAAGDTTNWKRHR